jgi:L-threonylcarbamoyladenylate synthase
MSDVRILETHDPRTLPHALLEAAAVIHAGGIVGHPTETVYGLAVDPWNPGAVERLERSKGREAARGPRKAGLILIVASIEEARALAAPALPAAFDALTAAFWPGPLTLVVPPGKGAPLAAIGSSGGIAIRWTSDAVAQGLVRAAGKALTSTSANRTGERPATSAREILEIAGVPVDLVLDDGPRLSRVASTLVDLEGAVPRLLREGAVARASLEKVAGPIGDPDR